MVSGVLALLLGHDHRLALGPHHDLVLGLLEVEHLDHTTATASREQRRLVDQVGQIGTREARCATREDVGADVLADRHLAHVDVEDLLASAHVGQGHVHLAVEPARAQQCGVEDVGPVGRRHHDHADIGLEAVHLDQHLVQGLFALVVATAQTGTAVPPDRVDFIDEDDAGRALLGLVEHVAHTRRTDTDEHLDKIRARDREERHLGFTRDRLREQGLAGTGGPHQQHAARNAATELLELLRVFQEVDQLLDLFLRLVAAGDVGKGGRVVGFIEHAGLALAEAERPALAATLHLPHEIDPNADEQEDRAPRSQDAEQERRLLALLDIELDVVADEVADEAAIQRCGSGADVLVVGRFGPDLGASATHILQNDALHTLGPDFFEKLRVAHHAALRGRSIELLEHGEQHECDHQPHSNFREPLIVHRDSISGLYQAGSAPRAATPAICGRF